MHYTPYSDSDLAPWFEEVFAGYTFEQAAHRLGMDWKRTQQTYYGDREIVDHALGLSIAAGSLIRAGEKEVPLDRWDDYYDPYLDSNNWIPMYK